MRHFDKAIFILVCANIEIDVTRLPKFIVLGETGIGHNLAAARPRHLHCLKNILRSPRTRNSDQYISRPSMKIELFGEYVMVAEVLAETRQRRRIIKGQSS